MAGVEIDYHVLSDALNRAGILPALAELHGEICGVMCSGGVAATGRWLDESLKESAKGAGEWNEARDKLRELEDETWRMLTARDMAFEPLLPDDDRPLEEQVEAMASWCHGFLAGLGLGGFEQSDDETSEQLEEIVSDFSEISRAAVDAEDAAAPEESAFALAEVKEYVRVSVQIVFEELAKARDAREKGSLH